MTIKETGVYETPEMNVALMHADSFLCQSTGTVTILNWTEDNSAESGIWE